MRKFFVSMIIACSASVMLSGCIVSDEKLEQKVTQGMVEYALIVAFIVGIATLIFGTDGSMKDAVSKAFEKVKTAVG